MLLVFLALAWAAFLIPPMLRNRGTRSADSISSFRQQLRTLERTTPGGLPRIPRPQAALQPIAIRAQSGMPVGRGEARRRRRDILFVLAGTVVITLLLAVVMPGGVTVVFQLAADATLGAYVFLLVQMRKTEAERSAKVRYLPRADAPEPAFIRSASN